MPDLTWSFGFFKQIYSDVDVIQRIVEINEIKQFFLIYMYFCAERTIYGMS